MTSFNMFWNVNLLVICTSRYCMSEMLPFCLLFLEDNFAGYWVTGLEGFFCLFVIVFVLLLFLYIVVPHSFSKKLLHILFNWLFFFGEFSVYIMKRIRCLFSSLIHKELGTYHFHPHNNNWKSTLLTSVRELGSLDK